MFKVGEIVIYKDTKYFFRFYQGNCNALICNKDVMIGHDYIIVNKNDIVRYSVIEREDKFKNLLDV